MLHESAHLHLSGHGDRVPETREHYRESLDEELWRGFAGAEILRRLLGVAQLPLGEGADRSALLDVGKRLLLGGSTLLVLILSTVGCRPAAETYLTGLTPAIRPRSPGGAWHSTRATAVAAPHSPPQ